MSRELVTHGQPITWAHLPRHFTGKATELMKVSDTDGSINFTTKITKSGSPILAGAPFVLLAHVGHNGAGAVTLAGVKKGDKVVSVTNLSAPADLTSSFESTITVNDQIQQSSASDLSAVVCLFYVVKQS